VLSQLGIEDPKLNKSKATINDPDVVFIHPQGGKLFVGGQVPANSIRMLEKYSIFHVVNCKGKEG
jgi:hypothetical protein